MGSELIVERRTAMPVPPRDVFAWHTRPGALERLVPPRRTVRVLASSGRGAPRAAGPPPGRLRLAHQARRAGAAGPALAYRAGSRLERPGRERLASSPPDPRRS